MKLNKFKFCFCVYLTDGTTFGTNSGWATAWPNDSCQGPYASICWTVCIRYEKENNNKYRKNKYVHHLIWVSMTRWERVEYFSAAINIWWRFVSLADRLGGKWALSSQTSAMSRYRFNISSRQLIQGDMLLQQLFRNYGMCTICVSVSKCLCKRNVFHFMSPPCSMTFLINKFYPSRSCHRRQIIAIEKLIRKTVDNYFTKYY